MRIPKERLQRVLGLPGRTRGLSPGEKLAVLFVALALIVLAVVWLDPRPSLRHVRATMLSGSATGNYFATVGKLAGEVSRQKGRLTNVATAGSVENVARLSKSRSSCEAHFALVQGGIDWPEDHGLVLIGRLPREESLVVLGRRADAIRSIEELRGLRLGIGPVGSGTEHLMRRVLAPLAGLDFRVATPSIDEQLDLLERGELDLGAMVIDEDATLLADAVGRRGLQILSIPDVASLAKRLPFARAGRLEAGQIDYVRRLPTEAKQVLKVETLIAGNGCASHSVTQGLMVAVAESFPTFVRHNRGEANLTGLPLDAVARAFFDEEGPDLVGRHAPWIVDIAPTSAWIKLFLGFSVLFSGMKLWHRFRLWRIDADRVKVEQRIPPLFGAGTTVGDIASMSVRGEHADAAARAQLDGVAEQLVALAERCRRHSLSTLVPMGEEMAYRYQETLIADTLHALRAYRARLPEADG
jgi:hypothetical protein